jgi:hypothetical protein
MPPASRLSWRPGPPAARQPRRISYGMRTARRTPGLVVMTTENTTGMIRSTLAAAPQRGQRAVTQEPEDLRALQPKPTPKRPSAYSARSFRRGRTQGANRPLRHALWPADRHLPGQYPPLWRAAGPWRTPARQSRWIVMSPGSL